MPRNSSSHCAGLPHSKCTQLQTCTPYKVKGKAHCRVRKGTPQYEPVGTHLLRNGDLVNVYRGPKGGKFYMSPSGRKVYE